MTGVDGDYYLIKLVKKRPVLWDKSKQGNKDLSARNLAWKEISTIIDVEDDWIRSRWYNLRERFVKELKSSVNDKNHIRFRHFNSMLFLLKHVEFRKKPPADVGSYINQLLENSEGTNLKNKEEFVITQNEIEQIDRIEPNVLFTELTNYKEDTHPTTSVRKVYTTSKFNNTACNSQSEKYSTSNHGPKNYEELEESPSKKSCSSSKKSWVPCNFDENITVSDSCVRYENNGTESYDARCEDTIFGELVAATLRRMSDAKKNCVKKEIMNILLS